MQNHPYSLFVELTAEPSERRSEDDPGIPLYINITTIFAVQKARDKTGVLVTAQGVINCDMPYEDVRDAVSAAWHGPRTH